MRRAVVAIAGLVVLAACTTPSPPSATGGKIEVVAAESFWGSIASQLGGDRVAVDSIVAKPDTDPHDYEPTPADARAIAGAELVIVNGLGYDEWASQAVAANGSPSGAVIDVGSLLGHRDGDNPHRWYFPDDVERVITEITARYQAIDPPHAAYFDAQRQAFETTGLARYKQLLAQIRTRFSGTPVGASETVFVGLAEATGLPLLTPPSFLAAISEGTDPTPRDRAAAQAQLADGRVKVFVVNSQNATPDVQVLVDDARAHGVGVTAITETPPANASFQDWQAQQLEALADALARATGR